MVSPALKFEGTVADPCGLIALADEVHLDPAVLTVVDRVVGKGGQVEFAVEFPV